MPARLPPERDGWAGGRFDTFPSDRQVVGAGRFVPRPGGAFRAGRDPGTSRRPRVRRMTFATGI